MNAESAETGSVPKREPCRQRVCVGIVLVHDEKNREDGVDSP